MGDKWEGGGEVRLRGGEDMPTMWNRAAQRTRKAWNHAVKSTRPILLGDGGRQAGDKCKWKRDKVPKPLRSGPTVH